MARNAKIYRGNPVAFVLQLVSSFIFMWLVFAYGGALLQVNGLWSVWVPLFFGLATVASIGLFFVSFANLVGLPPAAFVGMPISGVAGVTLIALTATSSAAGFGSALYDAAVVGFVIALIGGVTAMKSFVDRLISGR